MEENHANDIDVRSHLIRALSFISPPNTDVILLEDRFLEIYPSKRWYATNPSNIVNLKYLLQTLENMVLYEDFKVENLDSLLDACYKQHFSKSRNPKKFEEAISDIKIKRGLVCEEKPTTHCEEYVSFTKILPKLIEATGYKECTIRKIARIYPEDFYIVDKTVVGGKIRVSQIDEFIVFLKICKVKGRLNSKARGFSFSGKR